MANVNSVHTSRSRLLAVRIHIRGSEYWLIGLCRTASWDMDKKKKATEPSKGNALPPSRKKSKTSSWLPSTDHTTGSTCQNPTCLRQFRAHKHLLSHLQQSKGGCGDYFAKTQFQMHPGQLDKLSSHLQAKSHMMESAVMELAIPSSLATTPVAGSESDYSLSGLVVEFSSSSSQWWYEYYRY